MRSRISCFSCRASKRRCDKQYPTCGLCSKRGISCHFPVQRGDKYDPQPRQRTTWAPTPDSSEHLDGDDAISSRSVQNAAAPVTVGRSHKGKNSRDETYRSALAFLTPDLSPRITLPDYEVPSAVSDALGTVAQMRETATQFFHNTQHYFPILARKHYYASLLGLSAGSAPLPSGLAILSLAMKLMTMDPADEEGHAIYNILRIILRDAQDAVEPCLQLLQTNLILCLYEVSHAIFPGAYLTVGQCARYSQLLGTKRYVDAAGKGSSSLGWTETEEHRRVWWGILILDRLLKLLRPSAPLIVECPPYETHLPSDDHVFDEASSKSPLPVTISTGLSLEMGLFSRLCQGVFLTSQAFTLIDRLHQTETTSPPASSSSVPSSSFEEQTSQLRKTIIALVLASEEEAGVRRLEFCSQRAICYSTIFVLQQQQQKHLKNGEGERVWPETLHAVRDVCAMTRRLVQDCASVRELVPRMSPFLATMAYLCLLTIRHGLDAETREEFEDGKGTEHHITLLEMLSGRWRLAGAYLESLKFRMALEEVNAM